MSEQEFMQRLTEGVRVVILAGGRGTRFNAETEELPKPLIEVGGKPMLGHIMDLFESQGFNDICVLGGHLVDKIDAYLTSRYDCRAKPPGYDNITVYGERGKPITTHLFDTGVDATTGDRLMVLALEFMMSKTCIVTYGDGIANIKISELLAYHEAHRSRSGKSRVVTMTAVHPPGRFGALKIADDGKVTEFEEKPRDGWINGGFIVCDSGMVGQFVPKEPYFKGPYESFESGALPRICKAGLLAAYRLETYWHCMDSRRDVEEIESHIKANGGVPPWVKS